MKVLIVDDNPQMREMMRQYLPVSADDVRECSDGVNALSAYTEFHPDFVLMDWQMKLMDGLTATKEILRVFPEAYILLVTQFDDAELRATAFQSGVRGFVSKDDLLILRSILQTSGNCQPTVAKAEENKM